MEPGIFDIFKFKDQARVYADHLTEMGHHVRMVERTISACNYSYPVWVVVVLPLVEPKDA